MKLLLCRRCQDAVKLLPAIEKRMCACGASWGWCEDDGLHVTYGGEAIPIGFANSSLVHAIEYNDKHPPKDEGIRFEAFIIPESASTIRREE